MAYRIETVELFIRETPPGRMRFALGKAGAAPGPAQRGLVSPLGHVRLVLRDTTTGDETFGCAADRLSVRWLDKRPGREDLVKLEQLIELVHRARDIYLEQPEFETPFEIWERCHHRVMQAGRAAGQEDLTSSYASAQLERAVTDAVCRMQKLPLFQALKQDRLGVDPARVHPELAELKLPNLLPASPRTRFSIRHTVGLVDPLIDSDRKDDERIGDGLPETLREYVERDGVRHFKIKISGDPNHDLERLARIWDVIVHAEQPVITLDANEAYDNLDVFTEFLTRLEADQVGLFQHIAYVEQPLPRALTFEPSTAPAIRRLAERKRMMIDEADGTVDAYRRARELGYQGTSHKNCKGFFKSLLNYAYTMHAALNGEDAFLSAEDLSNLPVVPLHQDFTALGVLDLEHCERNGHHYNYGLSMLSPHDKQNALRHHPDLYEQRGDEAFLRIRDGEVHCASLQCPGFGVRDEPDWASMTPMRKWFKAYAAR